MDNEDLKKKAADGAEKAKETAGKAKDKAKEFYGKVKESGLVKKISEKTKLGANAVMGIAGGIVLVLLVVIIAVANHKSPEERLAREYAKAAKVAAKTLGADDFSDVKSALKAVDTAANVVKKVSSTGKSSKKENKVKFATKPNPETDFVYDLSEDGQGIVISDYTGESPFVMIPETIEGYPVVQVGPKKDFGWFPVKSIVFPKSVKKVYYLSGLNLRIDIENLEYIGDNAFLECTFEKTKIKIPEGCFVGDFAFDSSNITEIVFPEGMEKVPHGVCTSCKSLKSVTFPKSLKSISDGAFQYCSNLENVSIPENAKYDYPENDGIPFTEVAFFNCPRLNLKQRAAIKATGYTGTFANDF